MIEKIEFWAFTAVMGVISYFLKRTMVRVDKSEDGLHEIRETFAKKDDVEEIKKNYTTRTDFNKGIEEIHGDLKALNKSSITREDSLSGQRDLSKKIDRVTELLLEKNGR